MANLITALAIAGCRKSDGTACASGYVFLYMPGTTTIVPGYRDDALSQTWSTVAGGIQLDAGGRAAIWVDRRVDVVVTDASGTTVESLLGFNGTTANAVEVENENYTGAITDPVTGNVTQGLGGLTDLDTVLSGGAASLGPGLQYQESPGATKRNYHDVIQGMQITPYDFGAIGNGVIDDTAAVQAALNELKRLESGTLWLSGAFLCSAGLSLIGTNGIRLVGSGPLASTLLFKNGSSPGLTLTNCSNVVLDSFVVVLAASPTASVPGLSFANGTGAPTNTICNNVGVNGFDIAVQDGIAQTSYRDCTLIGNTGSTTARGIFFSGGVGHYVGGGVVGGGSTGAAVEFKGTAGAGAIVGTQFSVPGTGGIGVLWNATLTGRRFSVLGCSGLSSYAGAGATAFVNNNSNDVQATQVGNGIDQSLYSAAVGNTLSIVLANGLSPVLLAAAGGAGTMTVAAPAPNPAGNLTSYTYLDVSFVNGAGGAVTWTLNAIFVLAGGVAIPSTDGHTINVRFRWDYLNSKWREVSRADTTT